jgi:sec-independent protein translocase protein TatB
LRVAGYWVRKARNLSREFHSSVEQMIRDAELDEMRQELNKVSEINIGRELQNTIDPTGSLAESLRPPELPDFLDPVPTRELAASDGKALPPPVPVAAGEPVIEPPQMHEFEPPPIHGFEPSPIHGFEPPGHDGKGDAVPAVGVR